MLFQSAQFILTPKEYSLLVLRSEIPSGMCAKLRTMAASNNRDHPTRSLYYCLFAPHTYIFVLRGYPVRGESHNQRNTTGEAATTSPPFLQRTTPIARSLREGWTPHDLHILVTAPFVAIGNPEWHGAKLRTVAASNNRDYPTRSLYYCLFVPHTYIFVLRAQPVHGESHNQRNTTGQAATRWKINMLYNFIGFFESCQK